MEEQVTVLKQRLVNLKLKTKLGTSFALLAIFTAALLTFALYINFRARLREDIRERLHDVVGIASYQINSEAHATLIDPEDEGNPTYMRIKRDLQRIRDAGTNIRFVYTMRRDAQGQIIFVVDAEAEPEDIAHLGEVYHDASPMLKAKFATLDHPIVEKTFYTDKWGTWLTGYAPFFSPDGRQEGVIGMDITATNVLAREQRFLWIALAIFASTVAIALALGWLLGKRLAAPIVALTGGAKRIADGDLNYRVPVRGGGEINELATALNSMTYQLGQSMRGLQTEVDERKKVQQELTRHRDHLGDLVVNRTIELEKVNERLQQDIIKRRQAEEDKERLITELKDALSKVKTLGSLLPICASCKKIRDDQGYWSQIEAYIQDHSETEFSHSLCPDCAKKLYPRLYDGDE